MGDKPDDEIPENYSPVDEKVVDFPGKLAGVVKDFRSKPGAKMARIVAEGNKKLGIRMLSPSSLEVPEPIRRRYNRPAIRKQVLYSDRIADEIIDRLATGETLASICSDRRMPCYTAVLRWSKTMDDFKEKLDQAKKDGAHHIADDCVRIADDLSIDPAHKRVMTDVRLKLIKSWNQKSYGDNVKLSGDEGGSPVRFFIEGLSDHAVKTSKLND